MLPEIIPPPPTSGPLTASSPVIRVLTMLAVGVAHVLQPGGEVRRVAGA